MLVFVIAVIVSVLVAELVLDSLNLHHRHQPIPENVAHLYDEAKYQTWLAYTMVNFKLSTVSKAVRTVVLLGLLLFGFFGFLEDFVTDLTANALFQLPLFLGSIALIFYVVGLPFRIVRTFGVEERFGFNKTTPKLFVIDALKSLALTFVFGGGILILLALIFEQFSERLGLLLGVTYGALVTLMVVIFLINGFLIRTFNTLTPLEEGSLKSQIDALAEKLGFSIRRIFVMDASKRSTKLNAFFTGLGKTREVVLFDTLVDKLGEDEIVSVLAHELGHATHKDAPRMLIQQMLYVGFYMAILGFIVSTPALFTAFGLGGVHFGFALLLLLYLVQPFDLLSGIVFNHLSRVAEYKADAFAVKHTSAQAMQGALEKLAVENLANLTPHPVYQLVYYSHPTMSKRLKALEK